MSDLNVLAEMRDAHPAPAGGVAVLADGLAALAIGVALAVVVGALARLFMSRRRAFKDRCLTRLREARTYPQDERVAAQASVLRDVEAAIETRPGNDWRSRLQPTLGDAFFRSGAGAGLRDALYRRDADFDTEEFERALTKTLSRVGR